MISKEEIIEKLRNNGQRLTKIKSEVIDIFLKTKGYLDASSVHEQLDKKADLSTVYRNLESLYDAGVLDIVYKNDKRWFKLIELHEHTHYVVCEKCGSRKELDFCPFSHINSQIEGYDIHTHVFELFGICPNCRGKK